MIIEAYLRHKAHCNAIGTIQGFCTCGRDQAAAELARLLAESENRRVALLAKSDEVRREWIRAENAEAKFQAVEDVVEKWEKELSADVDYDRYDLEQNQYFGTLAKCKDDIAAALRGEVQK